jgi:hypothetical protein
MDEKPPYSEFALAGFVLGIISVFAFTGFVGGMINLLVVLPVFILIIILITLLGIIPALGIIFSSIGIFKTGKKKKKGKVLAIIGLVLSTIIFIYSIYIIPRLFSSGG